jgi:CubicO group peptidase (beta-lactamase class C family)
VEVTSPSAAGVRASGIADFLDAVEADHRIEPHGLIVQRHGRRVVEGYWAPHAARHSRLVYSLSKSFTGTALGLQIGEGRLSLDDLVSDHLPEFFDDATPDATRRMRIRHIASMASGHAAETLFDAYTADPDDPVRGFLRIRPDAEPGTVFAYNQPPVLTLARILQRLAGERLVDYLRPRVLDPIGAGELRWRQLPEGFDMGFSGVYTDLDTVARLGQLYLDDGVWNGRRVLPEGWVAQASTVQTPNGGWEQMDWQQGYGFQFWMSRHGYRGDGAFGQFMVILPDHDAVVAMYSCTDEMQVILDAMWEHLLPAFVDGARLTGVDDDALDDALAERMAHLALPTVGERLGGASPGERALPAMTFSRSAAEPSHFTVTAVETDGERLRVHEDDGVIELPLTPGWSVVDDSIAASATVLDDGRITADVVFLATPHRLEVELDPTGATFVARWPLMPLFGVGPDHRLAVLRTPAD